MKLADEQIVCTNPIHCSRNSDGCNYRIRESNKFLFHERSYFPWMGKPSHEQWFTQFNLTKVECETIAQKFGGQAEEHFYGPDGSFFPRFADTEKALAFVRSKEFDQLITDAGKIFVD